MQVPAAKSRGIRFGVFEVDLQEAELRKSGIRIKLQEQPFQILTTLLEHPGQTVTREELQRRLWPADTFVDFDHSLNSSVKKLREALGDDSDNPRFIETLHRRGYRFIAPVDGSRAADVDVTDLALTAALGPSAAPAKRFSVPLAWSVGTLALIVVLLLALNIRGWRDQLLGRTARSNIESLAVLPLANFSGDPQQEYFADGMTEALIAELGQIGSLRVISRTSIMQYKGAKKPVAQIARELNVDAVIEGSVLRAGDRVRVTAQLIAAVPERHLWARSYERDLRDVLSLQREIASTIADEVRANVSPAVQLRFASARPVNPQAHDAYLKGLFFFDKTTEDGFLKAVRYAQEAVLIDPNYAQAYGLMALSYFANSQNAYGHLSNAQAAEKAKAAAMKALAIDGSLAEAHVALGAVDLYHDWDWVGAERSFKRAIELNPNLGAAHSEYGWYLAIMGRQDESIQEAKRALELDPFTPHTIHSLASMYYYARQYDEALQQIRKCIEIFPDNLACHAWLTEILQGNGMYEQEVLAWQKTLILRGEKNEDAAGLGRAYNAGGIKNVWRWEIGRLKTRLAQDQFAPTKLAALYALLGEKEQALGWLEKGYAEHDDHMYRIKANPGYDSLRSDPHFQGLLRRMNFPR